MTPSKKRESPCCCEAAEDVEALDDDGTNKFNKEVALDVILELVPPMLEDPPPIGGWDTVCSNLPEFIPTCSEVFLVGGFKALGLGGFVLDQLRKRYSEAERQSLPSIIW